MPKVTPKPKRSMAERYETSFLLNYNKAHKDIKLKIDAAKTNPDTTDRDVQEFVRLVIQEAERI